MWPAFVAMTLLDGVVGHLLPPEGQSQHFLGAAILGCFLNLFAIVVLAWPVSLLLRRRRPDLPKIIARDYGGAMAICAISVGILTVGLIHRPVMLAHRQAAADAEALAEAWIGDRAPATFRRNARYMDSYVIEAGSVYRECVHSSDGRRNFCVIVNTKLPLSRSVSFAGYESNEVLSQGTQ